MPRDGSGNFNLPAGNPVIGNTTILASQFNSTMNDVATALSGSLPRDGSASMTGPFRLPDGSAAIPSFGFNSEASTGLFRPGTNTLGFTVGGGERFRVLSNGNFIIGSTSDNGNRLQVSGSATFTDTATVSSGTTNSVIVGPGNVEIFSTTAAYIDFKNVSTDDFDARVILNAAGNALDFTAGSAAGVHTFTSSSGVDIVHPGTVSFGMAAQLKTIGGTDNPRLGFQFFNSGSPANWSIGTSGASNFTIAAGGSRTAFGSQVLSISSSGDLLIERGITAKANSTFISNSVGTSWSDGALQIRETNQVGAGQTGQAYAPKLVFHWGGIIARSVEMTSGGNINWYDGTLNQVLVFDNASSGISVNRAGVVRDPYGMVSVTMPTDQSYPYFGMTRSGQIGWKIGIGTDNRLMFGTGNAGHLAPITSAPLSVSAAGTVFLNNATTTSVTNDGDLFVTRASSPTTGVVFLGNQAGGSRYLFYNGTNYELVGSNVNVKGSTNGYGAIFVQAGGAPAGGTDGDFFFIY